MTPSGGSERLSKHHKLEMRAKFPTARFFAIQSTVSAYNEMPELLDLRDVPSLAIFENGQTRRIIRGQCSPQPSSGNCEHRGKNTKRHVTLHSTKFVKNRDDEAVSSLLVRRLFVDRDCVADDSENGVGNRFRFLLI